MMGNAAVYASSRTRHCVALSNTEAEYVALAEDAKKGRIFVRSVMSFMQPNVDEITLMEDNEGGKAMAENSLRSDRNKHIEQRFGEIKKELFLKSEARNLTF